jgi:DNA-binding LytR/AlgR family response regulator
VNTVLKIAVCEDSPDDAKALRELVECADVGVEISEMSFFTSGEEFLASSPADRYDAVFMDVYFADVLASDGRLTGVDASKALRERDERVEIVFTTTSEGHALEAYRLNAAQYLVKPLKREDVDKALRSIALKVKSLQEVCSIIVNRQKVDIPLTNIVYAEVQGFRCLIHTTEGAPLMVRCSLDELQKQLTSPSFYRCHKSYIVNFRYVKQIDEDFTMKNCDVAYIRKRGAKEASDAYKAWLADAVWRKEI